MAFFAKDHKIAEKGGISSNGGSTLDSSHNPGNNIFTYASLFQDIKSQKRTTFNIASAIDNNASTTGRPLDYNSTFVEAKDDYSVIDCSQFAGMVFREKPLLTCLRDYYSKGLGIRTRMVGKYHTVIEINFPSQGDCEEALNKELVLQGKIIKMNKALDKKCQRLQKGEKEGYIPFVEIPSDDEALSKGEVSSADEPESDSDAENVQGHSTNLNDSKDMQMEEVFDNRDQEEMNESQVGASQEGGSHDGESQDGESQVAESEGRKSQAGSLSQEDAPNRHLEEEDNNSFGDEEYAKSTSEEDSDGESPKVIQNNVSRYNLRHSGHKKNVDEPTEEHPKRSIDELASTPPVEDSESPGKKQIKQQETNARDKMVLDGSSTTNTL
ncbi:uncharacterized protein ATC70_003676 [Mucor velutinosus]|uniref:Uncharacterized protein n=1 Tax=Mucor velutinosus TaxID=708070 RepID=A0AAN7DBY8_9FUNG|nr:hypothetical protein ATC70_003676 [Mucor velutinosus]